MPGGHQNLRTFGNSSERRYFQAYFEYMEIQIIKKNMEKLRKSKKIDRNQRKIRSNEKNERKIKENTKNQSKKKEKLKKIKKK